MPGRDRRGPLGQGPMTGRGLGLCGRGLRRGLGRRRMSDDSSVDQKRLLQEELESLEAEKQRIQKLIEGLD